MTRHKRPHPLASPPSARNPPRWTQLSLDVGQRDASARRCVACSMVYAPGLDAAAHRRFHASFLRGPTVGARALRGLPRASAHAAADVFVVGQGASAPARRAAARALAHASAAVGGACAPAAVGGAATRVVMAVRGGRVRGVACVERVAGGRRAAVWADGRVEVAAEGGGGGVVGQMCGVRVLWVAEGGARRQGLASEMVDVARKSLVYAHVFAKVDVAFTSPTAQGARFAVRYAPQSMPAGERLQGAGVSGGHCGDSGGEKKDESAVLGHILVYGVQSVAGDVAASK